MPITLNSKVYDNVGFNPQGQFVYSEKSAGVPSGFSYLTAKVNTGTGKSDSVVKWNLSIPIVATTDSSCACIGGVLRTYYVRMEITEPAGATAAERTDVRARIASLIAATQFIGSVVDLTQPSS